jgi:hypothetical protein
MLESHIHKYNSTDWTYGNAITHSTVVFHITKDLVIARTAPRLGESAIVRDILHPIRTRTGRKETCLHGSLDAASGDWNRSSIGKKWQGRQKSDERFKANHDELMSVGFW